MGEMLTIRELAKRFDDSEQAVRRALRKLIQAGRLKPDADFCIENEHDVHHRVYFAVPSRFEDEGHGTAAGSERRRCPHRVGVPSRQTSDLCRVEAYQGVTLTWGFGQKPVVNNGFTLRLASLFRTVSRRPVSDLCQVLRLGPS